MFNRKSSVFSELKSASKINIIPTKIVYCYTSMQCNKIVPEVIDPMAYPKKAEKDKYVRTNVTMSPELQERLIRYCQKEERTMSWCIQKALDEWLAKKGE